MGVTVRGRVNVHVKQPRTPGRMGELQPRLFFRLAESRVVWHLTGLEVTAGLHPTAEALVEMEDRAARPDHHCRAGHMHRIRILVEGLLQPFELLQDPFAASISRSSPGL
jgi:hypothetical protein